MGLVVVVKDLIYGTKAERMSLEYFMLLLLKWESGEDIVVAGEVIKNEWIEAIRICKEEQ